MCRGFSTESGGSPCGSGAGQDLRTSVVFAHTKHPNRTCALAQGKCWVVPPPRRQPPKAIVHFLGGAFVSGAPQVCRTPHHLPLLQECSIRTIAVKHGQCLVRVFTCQLWHTCITICTCLRTDKLQRGVLRNRQAAEREGCGAGIGLFCTLVNVPLWLRKADQEGSIFSSWTRLVRVVRD